MKLLQRITTYFDSLNKRSFYIFLGLSIGLVSLIAAGLFWWGSSSVTQAQEKLDDVIAQQATVQKILVKNVQTEQEQKYINKTIEENPDFNLLAYADSIFKRYTIKPSREKIDEVRSDFYLERAAQFAIDETDMKTLTEIIQLFDDNERVTLKEVSIKPGPGRTINVVMTVAALYKKPKNE